MLAPAMGQIMDDFHFTDELLSSFVVSVFVLGFAAGPLAIAPLSEIYGRLIFYNICNVLFLIFNIAAAVSSGTVMLIVFRFLAGFAGSAPLTLGGGTISDVIPLESRGKAMALYALGPLVGPVAGPVMAGFITQGAGWRWVFWVVAITVSSSSGISSKINKH